MNTLDNRRTVGGVELEAVRFLAPCPHWRVRVVETGFTFEAGCFRSRSRPQLWESVEHTARIRGDLWQKDTLGAL